MNRSKDYAATVIGPRQAYRADLVSSLTIGLMGGLILVGVDDRRLGLIFGLAAGLVFGLAYSAIGPIWLCQLYLCFRHRTPLRLVQFLEDAHARHLLRTVCPVYQFRHATLQMYRYRDVLRPLWADGSHVVVSPSRTCPDSRLSRGLPSPSLATVGNRPSDPVRAVTAPGPVRVGRRAVAERRRTS